MNDECLVFPIVHMNGSGKTNLVNGYRKAWGALSMAMDDLLAISPHMRDYYPLEDGIKLYERARRQHLDRIAALEQIKDDMERLAFHVQK